MESSLLVRGCEINYNGEVLPAQAMNEYRDSRGLAPLILKLATVETRDHIQ